MFIKGCEGEMKELFGQSLDDVFRNQESIVKSKKQDKNLRPYERIEWEILVSLLRYDEHVKRLNESKWTRAPSPQEVFSLLTDYFQGKLTGYYKDIASNLIKLPGEFLCNAIYVDGSELMVYENVRNIYYSNKEKSYKISDPIWFDNVKNFNVNLPVNQFSLVSAFPKEFVEYLYTRTADKLPKDQTHNARIHVPEKLRLYPIKRMKNSLFDIDVVVNYIAISRGVREK